MTELTTEQYLKERDAHVNEAIDQLMKPKGIKAEDGLAGLLNQLENLTMGKRQAE